MLWQKKALMLAPPHPLEHLIQLRGHFRRKGYSKTRVGKHYASPSVLDIEKNVLVQNK